MEQKMFPLSNRGMSRDTSISKEKNEFAFENHNIRILARDHDTLLSVTNERGNKKVDKLVIQGTVIGWNTLNDYIILFTTKKYEIEGGYSFVDRIYRIEYSRTSRPQFKKILIFSGQLGFDVHYPIESVVDFESEDILKIYWVDGKNVLRFLNFSDKYLSEHGTIDETGNSPVFTDPTWFDSTRPASSELSVKISREGGGNTRPNGTAQYFITYYNKNGQQTGIVYSSPLVYLSPEGRGGAPNETNTNKIIVEVSNMDTSFEYIRLYQITNTSLEITNTAYLVDERTTSIGSIRFIDSGKPIESIDITSLLYLGSKEIHAGTLTQKDNTLFLGDLKSIGNSNISGLSETIKENAFEENNWESAIVRFIYSDNLSEDTLNIPYISAEGYYPYNSQLNHPNCKITTFKGGEKYRFALRFYRSNGTYTKSFWIGDQVNTLYPQITNSGIKRAIAICTIPKAILDEAGEFTSVQLMIAQADYTDRSVMAQGIVSPTLFNLYNRYRNVSFAQSSWIYRPKGGEYPYIHYNSLLNSDSRYSEIQNHYWDDTSNSPSPLYYIDREDGSILYLPYGTPDVDGIRLEYEYSKNWLKTCVGRLKVIFYKNDEALPPVKGPYFIFGNSSSTGNKSLDIAVKDLLKAYEEAGIPDGLRMDEQAIRNMFNALNPKRGGGRDEGSFTIPETGEYYPLSPSILNTNTQFATYSKEYYFVDENIVTVNSPEIEYNAINLDRNTGIKFRIVGVSRFTGDISDYDISTIDFNYVGDKLPRIKFSSENISNNIEGFTAWPLYIENKFEEAPSSDSEQTSDENELIEKMPISYMMYMWHKSGSIPEVTHNNKKISVLNKKIFANLHFSYYSIYNNYGTNVWKVDTLDDLRQFDAISSQLYSIKTGNFTGNYIANVDEISTTPNNVKYPILYSETISYDDSSLSLESDESRDTQSPVPITYNSKPHIVLSLPNTDEGSIILPYLFEEDSYVEPEIDEETTAGPFAPWKNITDYSEVEPSPIQKPYTIDMSLLPQGSKYMFIGELYFDYDAGYPEDDMRYGGISESAVEHNIFIPAGPKKSLEDTTPDNDTVVLRVIGNEGDTFFQRWDSVKTLPRSTDDINQVVDVASVMLETHINLDGRYDLDRGSTKLAYIDWNSFGKLNPVYSQPNNFLLGFDTDSSFDLDIYRSSITWSMEKKPNSDIDEWTHIPLSSSLKLDGDKGKISALRRYQNSILSFQERGIAEILFNSRTQIATTEGVPVEIANSGKVDGKRYLTNKYGTLNKWSIIEGKMGLYFIDNVNKMIGVLNGEGVKSLSTEQGFDAWVRDNNSTSEWNPDTFENFVTYYDKVHSDVYFIKNGKYNQPCIVYSEILGKFVSFYDYADVSMMTNIGDRFVSCKRDQYGNSSLWLQNEGLYGRFFDEDKPFWITWRVVPDNLTDKIWTNIEYRADFMKVLDNSGCNIISESDMIDGSVNSVVADKTFDSLEVWNEYQTTGEQNIPKRTSALWKDSYPDAVKRFRIWRMEIPRAIKSFTSGNRFGLDRIRNPWVYVKLKENEGNFGQEMLQLHDVVVKYFENR